jgi:hypothetical protein
MSKILVFGVFVLFLLSLGACNIKSLGVQIGEEPGPVVVAKSNSKGGPYSYRYYPSCYVYFDISRKFYFYLAGDGWMVSASLPASMRVQLGDHVSIEMDTDRPYTKFKEHKKKYPPGQLKKKKKKKEKWS